MIDRTVQGIKLHKRILPIAACNPYKFKENDFCTAGLRRKKIGEKKELVYKVCPFPESMLPYVWNYDTLEEDDERYYI